MTVRGNGNGHLDALRDALRAARLFAGLTEDRLTTLATAAREGDYAKDEIVILKGDPPTGVFVVIYGMIKMACQSPQGGEKVIDLIGPGELFGEAALLLDEPYPYMASALVPTRLLHIDRMALLDLVAASPRFAKQLLAQLSRRVYAGIRDIEDFRIRAPLSRLLGYLHEQGEPADANEAVVAFGVPKHVIASRLGMTPESLSRCLRELSDDGLIAVGADHVRVLDNDRLRRYADRG